MEFCSGKVSRGRGKDNGKLWVKSNFYSNFGFREEQWAVFPFLQTINFFFLQLRIGWKLIIKLLYSILKNLSPSIFME